MIINHNISAMNAQRLFDINHKSMNVNIERLSSGMRINRSRDDAAGLAISERMRAQVRGLNVASRNAQDGISLIQTAEGWLQETQDVIQRMRELAVQAANGVYTTEDRAYMQIEVNQLIDEVDRISQQAQFSDSAEQQLLGGTYGSPIPASPTSASQASDGDRAAAFANFTNVHVSEEDNALQIHVGANADQFLRVTIDNMNAHALGIRQATAEEAPRPEEVRNLSVEDEANANMSLTQLDQALSIVNAQRARLGAFQNRLEHAMRGINLASENLQASESLIRDTNMAGEMVDFVRNQILSQSTASMLAQANLKPQLVLRVLG